ncbi:MAG: hypothetical protein Q3983_09620 [Capnocytophaga sp.]|nr:hypothetical protein [Capnocytophaga sp.]
MSASSSGSYKLSSHLYDPEDEALTNCWEEKQYHYNDLHQKIKTEENSKLFCFLQKYLRIQKNVVPLPRFLRMIV